MTVTRVTRMRDYGVFRDFTWPVGLADFGRYNLIYGWNGSGKTTLSRLFRALENKTPPSPGEATICINGRDVTNGDFAQTTLTVRVFNRDFVRESVFPASGDVAPIFFFGKQNVEKQKEVEKLKTSLEKSQQALKDARQKKSSAETARDNFLIDQAKVIKDTLTTSGGGPYNNYNRSNFTRRVDEMATTGDAFLHRLDEITRGKLLAQHRATLKAELLPPAYQFPDLKKLADETSQLLSATVVSSAIAALKDDAPLAFWVHQGLVHHRDRNTDECLFCTQPLPKDRLAALETHFSTEYEGFLGKIDQKLKAVQAAAAATKLSLPNPAELYDDLKAEYEAAKSTAETQLQGVKESLDTLAKALLEKRSRAFEGMRLDAAVPHVDITAIEPISAVIGKHNRASDDFQSRIDSAGQRLEADSVSGNLDRFVELRDILRAAEESVETTSCGFRNVRPVRFTEAVTLRPIIMG